MQKLRADTSVKVVIGPFVDATDGVTPETAVSLSNASGNDATLFKHDNATGVAIDARTWGALTNGDGYYHLTLSTSDTDTEGMLSVLVTDGDTHLPVRCDFEVMNANAYDSLYAASGTDTLDVQVTGIGNNVITAESISDEAGDEIADQVWDEAISGHTGSGSVGELISGSLGASGAVVDTFTTTGKGEIEAEAVDALESFNLDHLMAVAVTGADVVDNSALAKLVSSSATADWDTFVNTTDSLQSMRDTLALEATVAALNDISATDVWAAATRTLTAGTNLNDLSTADVDARLAAIGLDHLVSASVTGADITDNSIIARLVSASATADWDDFDQTTDSLQALRDNLATAASITALNDISTADVNAQVLDVINTDTFAEVSGVPAATSTLADKIGWLFILARNKLTQTATTMTIRNDADSANVATSTVSDDGTTATRGEYS